MFPGIGTVVNVVTVLLGAGLGVLLGHRLSERTRDVVTDGLGLVTLLIAILSALAVTDPALVSYIGSSAPMLVVLGSLLVGGIVGSAAAAGAARRVARRVAAAPADLGHRDGGAPPLHRGLRRVVAAVLHRAAHDPRLPERRARARRRRAVPEGGPRRFRRDGVRGRLRLGRGRQRDHGGRGAGRPHRGRRAARATCSPMPTSRPSPRSAGCCSSASRCGCCGSARSRSPTCFRHLLVAPFLVALAAAVR